MNKNIISNLAVKSLIYEVSISPKSGLVSRFNNGSHKDMNFYTFIDSAFSLEKYFSDCFDYGQRNNFYSTEFFKNLRELGKVAEKEMYQATKGINTHKGTIFSMGILISVLSSYLKESETIDLKILSQKIKDMCSSLVDELKISQNLNNKKISHGEKVFKKYNLTGARGLAANGYDIVLNDGIYKLVEFNKKYDLETSCILLLFYYISILDDTNIVNRSNIEALLEMKKLSGELFEKCKSEDEIKDEMSKLNEIFIEKNISAGGSADLLILTLFIYFLFFEER